MLATTLFVVFALLQGSAKVLGNPFWKSSIHSGLQGWQQTRCRVRDLNHFVYYYIVLIFFSTSLLSKYDFIFDSLITMHIVIIVIVCITAQCWSLILD